MQAQKQEQEPQKHQPLTGIVLYEINKHVAYIRQC